MAENIQKLAGPANIHASTSVDQILAAAAAKLIQQGKEIQKLTEEVNTITRPEDGLYLNNNIVGRSLGEVKRDGKSLIFQLIIAGAGGLDFGQTFRYQKFSINCSKPDLVSQSGSFGVMQTRYPGVRCEILEAFPG